MKLIPRLDRALSTITGGLMHLFSKGSSGTVAPEIKSKIESTKEYLNDLKEEEARAFSLLKKMNSRSVEKARLIRHVIALRSQIKSTSALLKELINRSNELPKAGPSNQSPAHPNV